MTATSSPASPGALQGPLTAVREEQAVLYSESRSLVAGARAYNKLTERPANSSPTSHELRQSPLRAARGQRSRLGRCLDLLAMSSLQRARVRPLHYAARSEHQTQHSTFVEPKI